MTGRLVVLLLLLLGEACAQFNTGSVVMRGRVKVQIWFADHATCDPSTFVALIANDGSPSLIVLLTVTALPISLTFPPGTIA
jgi:hypothetical protein